jgi:hypothetical protein
LFDFNTNNGKNRPYGKTNGKRQSTNSEAFGLLATTNAIKFMHKNLQFKYYVYGLFIELTTNA